MGWKVRKGNLRLGAELCIVSFLLQHASPALCSSLFPSPFLLHVYSLLCFPVSLSPAFRLQSPASFPLPHYLISLFPAFLRFPNSTLILIFPEPISYLLPLPCSCNSLFNHKKASEAIAPCS